VINGILYGTNATLQLFALRAATGEELWRFDPFKDATPRYNQCRGVAYWENGDDKRLFYTAGSNLYAVNALTGKPVNSFGANGIVSLYTGLDINHDVKNLYVTATSPGIIYKNTLILGSAVSESGDAAPGYVRGFDVVTGKISWTFHTIPQPGEFGYDTWPKEAYKWAGGTNNWAAWPWMRKEDWSISVRDPLPRTSMAVIVPASTYFQIVSWRSTQHPARCDGITRPYTMTYGTGISPVPQPGHR